MNNPLISVIIPTYNDAFWIEEAIASIQHQTYANTEIIVVNDGSTEPKTLAILHELENKGIQVLHKSNGRMSAARNYGIKAAKGSIIACLDCDDYFHPSFFEKAVYILANSPQVGVVTSYIQLFGTYTKTARPRGGNKFNFLFNSECPACCIFKKEAWEKAGGFDESMILGYEDWEFFIRVTQLNYEVAVIPEKLLFYRQTNKSTLANHTEPNREKIVRYIVEKHKDWYTEQLIQLITQKEVLYKKSRIAYPDIIQMIKDRIFKKYK
ncbi:MAG: glycosyltransferase family 2 protein [Sediminibacterium sp.]|nr:glycosyltransferase family 2 protein [Chitinophagaceae bacterium]MCA6447458.1 glycosyltransferase family 2 protein [Chitinophagaceae bacterium]